MSDNEINLRAMLAYHGSNVSRWPYEARARGREAQKDPLFTELFEDERSLERLLLSRDVPPMRQDMIQRIIDASLALPRRDIPAGWFRELLAEVRPAALAAMLVLGFAIGFGMMTPRVQGHDSVALQTSVDDEGALL